MKILVIDDFAFMADCVRKYLPNDEIDHHYQLPDDNSEYDQYDVLVVDNQGIGNSKYRCGSDFLKDYCPTRKQLVIYYSGLEPEPVFETILDTKGFKFFVKGRDPDGLAKIVEEYRKET